MFYRKIQYSEKWEITNYIPKDFWQKQMDCRNGVRDLLPKMSSKLWRRVSLIRSKRPWPRTREIWVTPKLWYVLIRMIDFVQYSVKDDHRTSVQLIVFAERHRENRIQSIGWKSWVDGGGKISVDRQPSLWIQSSDPSFWIGQIQEKLYANVRWIQLRFGPHVSRYCRVHEPHFGPDGIHR